MCGLAGIYSKNKNIAQEDSAVKKMLNVALHRGPNNQGVFSLGNCQIGLNRLSIIDLKTGNQPIFSKDGNLVLVCNGEIYNYKDLKKILEKDGYIFQTNSDVEVIIYIYEKFGIDGFSRLDGMFAFALFDKKNNKLILARDRFGIKPLYFSQRGDDIFFASEIKSINSVYNRGKINHEVFYQFLTWGYSLDGNSIWEHINTLKPGFVLEINNNEIRHSSFLDNISSKCESISQENAMSKLKQAIIEDIEKQLMSDVPLGVFLSGGIDSSIIAGVIKKYLDMNISTFSIDFENSDFSELNKIEKVSKVFNTTHTTYRVGHDLLDIVDKVIASCDEPFGDPSALPMYILCENSSKDITVALSGDGADEFMFGYNHNNYSKNIINLDFIIKMLKKFVPISHPKLYSLISRISEKNVIPFNLYSEIKDSILKKSISNNILKINSIQEFDKHIYLPNDILYKTDRMSMAHSLECRVPFLGNKTAKISSMIPKNMQFVNGQGKYILRTTFKDLLPKSIKNQAKHGFTTPVGDWIKKKYSLNEFINLISSSFFSDILNQDFTSRLINEHYSNTFDHGRFVYRLFVADRWGKNYNMDKIYV